MTATKKCGAKTRSGGQCKRNPMPNGRCPLHGGKTPPPGPGHPNWKHGRRSRFKIAPDLLQRIQEYEASEKLLDLRRDAAIASARLDELLASIGSLPDLPTLQELARLVSDAQAALKEGRESDVGSSLKSMQLSVRRGMANEWAWLQVERTSERRRKLAATQLDQERKAGELIQRNTLLFIVDRLMTAIEKVVADRTAFSEIRRVFQSIMIPMLESPQEFIEVE